MTISYKCDTIDTDKEDGQPPKPKGIFKMTTICKKDMLEYTLIDGADVLESSGNMTVFTAPAIDEYGCKCVCYWFFHNEDIVDKDLEDLDWDFCDRVDICVE